MGSVRGSRRKDLPHAPSLKPKPQQPQGKGSHHRALRGYLAALILAALLNAVVQLAIHQQPCGGGDEVVGKSATFVGFPDRASFEQATGTKSKSLAAATTIASKTQNSDDDTDSCARDYRRATADRLVGLTDDDMVRSVAFAGNQNRLAKLAERLGMGGSSHASPIQPVTAAVCGGSISLGHGVDEPLRYSNRLEAWLHQHFPLENHRSKHTVHNLGSHGADVCAMAKRTNVLMEDLGPDVDLFVLEFAVNDYQGQDHRRQIDFKLDTFFDGFREIASCTESVLVKLLHHYPNAAIVFLEMRTAVVSRKTGALLHLGAAQHYGVPVISYDQVLFPEYARLVDLLEPFNYTHPRNDTIFPYPRGCFPCRLEDIEEGFRDAGCHSVCEFQNFRPNVPEWMECSQSMPQHRLPCFVPFLAHDEVHPSGIGHKIATDLLVHAIAGAGREACLRHQQRQQQPPTLLDTDVLPSVGWMVSDPRLLDAQTQFVWVNDTYPMFRDPTPLEPSSHTAGFALVEDRFDRWGWIATNPSGNESIVFEIDQATHHGSDDERACYIPYLSVLKSYKGMGIVNVTVYDHLTQQRTTTVMDSLWEPRISVPRDVQLLAANDLRSEPETGCSGRCTITITTLPQPPPPIENNTQKNTTPRTGNKVKIVSLSLRPCVPPHLVPPAEPEPWLEDEDSNEINEQASPSKDSNEINEPDNNEPAKSGSNQAEKGRTP